jgi:hypothetical protein
MWVVVNLLKTFYSKAPHPKYSLKEESRLRLLHWCIPIIIEGKSNLYGLSPE